MFFSWYELNLFCLLRLFGPKRKMTSAIARWHSSARPPSDALEQAYADQLEAEMQEMAIQLHKVKYRGKSHSHANISQLILLDQTEHVLSKWIDRSRCVALWGGGEPAEPGVPGERAAHCDGGMPHGGQDGLEESPHWAGGEPPTRSGNEC